MSGIGLVGADLLGGDDQIEVQRYVAPGLAQQLVVDVGDQPHLVVLGDLRQHRVGLLEGLPALDRVRQEPGPRGLQWPAELLGDLDSGPAQHLGVELVRPGLDLLLDLVKERDQLVALEREPVTHGLGVEGLERAGLPVDQGAVDVEGDKGNVFGDCHRWLMMPWGSRFCVYVPSANANQ